MNVQLFQIRLLIFICFIIVFCETGEVRSCNEYKLKNGRVRIKPKGKLGRFQCNKGFTLVGEKYGSCIRGQFDIQLPVCVKPTCKKMQDLKNGILLPSYNGAVINFYCKAEYQLRGNNMTYCDGTNWSKNLPICTEANYKPLTSCDFESDDLCGWSHDLNHDFDWRRQNFRTPSGHIGTGPQFDHTKGEHQDGYYVYIEATSRIENDVARLISPVYKTMNSLCFTFFYHMYGRDIGQLKIYIKKETDDFYKLKPLFQESGNQGDIWKKGVIQLEEGIDEDFQIIIEGVRGKGYISDIAIDDVSLTEFCPEETETTSFSTTGYEETSTDIPIFDSCENRCNIEENESQSDFKCECNDSCFLNNTCCPDFLPVCYGTEVTEFADENELSTTQDSTTEETIEESSLTTTQLKIIPEQKPSKNKITISVTETIKETTKSSIKVPKIITIKPAIKQENVTNNTTNIKPPQINNNNIPTFIKSFTSKYITTTSNTSTNSIKKIFFKTKSTEPYSTTTTLLPTTTVSPTTTELSTIIETIPESIEMETDYYVKTSSNPLVQFLSQNNKNPAPHLGKNDNNLIYIIGITAIVGVAFIIIIMIVVVKRYSYSCRKFGFRSNRSTDSMSDVRFLAGDEILDFTLRTAN